jgi:trimethylamine--corrinoid protein Co-methyltransferase
MVEWALTQTKRVVRLCARDPEKDVILDGRSSHHTTSSQGNQVIDLDTGERRLTTARDLAQGALVADAMDRLDVVNVMVAATDVVQAARTVHHFAICFANTGKHVRTGVLRPEEVPFIVRLVTAACGGEFRPILSVVYCTLSPLMHDGPTVEAALELVKLGVPMLLYPMPLAGGTSPATAAGTNLQHNVEVLSGLVLFQVLKPGAPVIYGAGPSQLDMRTGNWREAANGMATRLAQAAMGRFYNLPVNLTGLGSASHEIDFFSGYEGASACMLSYLSGADELYSMGLLGAEYLSLEKMVLDNHIAGQLELMVSPITVDAEHLQADVIAKVGAGGHYLARRETQAAVRKEYLEPWPPEGESMHEIAQREAREILANHRPLVLPEGASQEFETILAEAEEALA